MVLAFQRIVANLNAVQMRHETMDGKKYLAVPTVMLTEGVHTGNIGPLFYSNEQLRKNPFVWNHKPAVINHPVDSSGVPISACQAPVIEKQGVGILMNSDFDDRLKNEVWFDEEKLRTVEPRVMLALNKRQKVEVSTGLWYETDGIPGEWNGQKYNASVINIQPDHLAILMDDVGACSVAKGAGLLQNKAGDLSYGDIRDQARALLMANPAIGYAYITDVYPGYLVYESGGDKYYKIGYSVKDSKVKLSTTEPELVRKVTSYLTNVGGLILNSKDINEFHLPPVAPDGKITTNTEPSKETTMTVPVNQIPQGVSPLVDAALAAVSPANPPAATIAGPITRPAAISEIIAAGWAETDRPFLEAQPDDGLGRILSAARRKATPSAPAAMPGVAATVPAVAPAAAAPAPAVLNAAQQAQQFIAQAPPAVQAMLNNAMGEFQAKKDRLIQMIVANKANRFTPQYLASLDDVRVLEGMAALASVQQPTQMVNNYGGQGEVPMFLDSPLVINNGEQGGEIEPLPPTTIVFEDAKKTA